MTARAPVALAVGDTVPPRTIGPLTPTDIVRFAGAGGDFNPLHHDPAAATAAGFDGVIAMGQMTAGMLAGWLSDRCGVEHLRELEVRFLAPVRPGDLLELAGEVTAVRDGEAGEAVADLALTATVGATPVVRGEAVVVRVGGR
ncbi:MaoC family dehydratase [Actinomycetospora sp. CA-101289]|uniref:MaoC family dehydratase n=1 Tax=Actinomycetospora sp. CA-101289 TaxID=3239893 RepID=UPI003D979255